MATTTFLSNATVTINSVDVSDQVSSVALTVGYDALETTAMGDTGRRYTQGLQAVDVTLTMFNSYGAGEIEATLTAICGTSTTIVISPSGPTESASNPEYTITNAFLPTFTPINSAVGELSTVNVTFTIDNSPTFDAIGVKFARNAPVMVYSGLLADSVVPDGEITKVTASSPTTSHKVASISDVPYELNMVSVTSTD